MTGLDERQTGQQTIGDGEWSLDPTDHALSVSHRRGKLVDPLCAEIGRRLLLGEMQFNRWMVRRVEKVRFDEDRNVTRRITVDFNVREDAPVVIDRTGGRFWIVPITLMRRRTVVNMRITDEYGQVLPTPGIRLTQQLDESLLLAAVATLRPEVDYEKVLPFIRELVAGEKKESKQALASFGAEEQKMPTYLIPLASDPLVRAVVYLLCKNFSLYVFLPAGKKDETTKRHRLLNLEFNEPTGWNRMTPLVTQVDHMTFYRHDDQPTPRPVQPEDERDDRKESAGEVAGGRPEAAPSNSHSWRWRLLQAKRKVRVSFPAAMGLIPTSIRLQVPGAENASSYHLELTAPPGVEVVRARLLAGRPNEDGRKYTNDRVVGHTATVGLHGVEIPNGSLCLAQVDFRMTSRGWLTNAVFSCAVVAGGLWWLTIIASVHTKNWSTSQVTNIIAVLITTAAAVAATIAHSTFTGVAARMVSRLRLVAALAVAQPIIAAAALAFATEQEGSTPTVQLHLGTMIVLWINVGLATCAALLIGCALILSLWDERKGWNLASPWDMTTDDSGEECEPKNFVDALEDYGFKSTAIGILSAEGWHERYAWTDEKHETAVRVLHSSRTTRADSLFRCDNQHSACTIEHACPYKAGLQKADTA